MTTLDRGSFRVARAVFDHPVLKDDDYDRRSAWLSLIADAAWAARTVNCAGRLIKLQRGDLAHSLRFLGVKWGWDHKRVARFVDTLVEHGMVTKRMESGIGILTITNYDAYQSDITPGQWRDTDAPRTGTANGTLNGTLSDSESASAAGTSEIDRFASGTLNGTLNGTATPQGVSANRDRANKQIKESKNPSSKRMTDREIEPAFDEWWAAYPRKVEKKGAKAKYAAVVRGGEATPAQLLAGARAYAQAVADREARFVKHPKTWIGNGCWADERTPMAAAQSGQSGTAAVDEFWREKIRNFQNDSIWSVGSLGPRPREPGCRVPQHILAEFHIPPP